MAAPAVEVAHPHDVVCPLPACPDRASGHVGSIWTDPMFAGSVRPWRMTLRAEPTRVSAETGPYPAAHWVLRRHVDVAHHPARPDAAVLIACATAADTLARQVQGLPPLTAPAPQPAPVAEVCGECGIPIALDQDGRWLDPVGGTACGPPGMCDNLCWPGFPISPPCGLCAGTGDMYPTHRPLTAREDLA